MERKEKETLGVHRIEWARLATSYGRLGYRTLESERIIGASGLSRNGGVFFFRVSDSELRRVDTRHMGYD